MRESFEYQPAYPVYVAEAYAIAGKQTSAVSLFRQSDNPQKLRSEHLLYIQAFYRQENDSEGIAWVSAVLQGRDANVTKIIDGGNDGTRLEWPTL